MPKNANILIVDDDVNICANLNDILSNDGYRIKSVRTFGLAKQAVSKRFYNIAMVDLRLPGGSGIDLLKNIKKNSEETVVIVFTGFASLENAIAVLNEGAFAYLQKPLNMDEVRITIKKALKLQRLSTDNKTLLTRLKELSLKDPLTGLYNYRYLRERLSSEFRRSRRYILPLSLLMIDIGYFKSINDIYGHRYGDVILKEFSKYLLNSARINDIVVRYGGEEFLIILPDTNREGAVNFAKRLLEDAKKHVFDKKGKKIKLKVSMGISNFPENGIATESRLLNAADQALRDAKEKGGNTLAAYKGIDKKYIENIIRRSGKDNINKLKEKLFKLKNRVNQTLLESIYAFAKAIEAKDYYTSEHAESMVSIVTEIGKALNLSDIEIENLQHAATLHDLGKIGIPDRILHKRGKLTDKEFTKIKKHTQIGAEIIRCVHFLEGVVPLVLYHHERYDGLGYSNMRGEAIPLGARIISVADVYQALTSDRPYRKAYNEKEALKIIKDGAGTQFDPNIVNFFLKMKKK